MFTINNQLSIDLQQYVDIDSLYALHPYFTKAIVENWQYTSPMRSLKANVLNQTAWPLTDALRDIQNHPERFPNAEFYQELKDRDQLASYMRFMEPVNYSGLSLNLKYIKDPALWANREDPANIANAPACDKFSFFWQWLDQQNIFVTPARTTIYITEATMQGLEHRDVAGNSKPNQFIWINLDRRKKLYVVDIETNQHHYITDSPISIFDDRNYHGVDTSPYASWSIRVDGYFTEEFKKKTKLVQHFV
jgi:hypothetical protein